MSTPFASAPPLPSLPIMPKGTKRSQKPSAKAASSSSESGSSGRTGKCPKVHRVVWNTARIEALLDWLEEHPVEWQKLFSDSFKDAKDEGWHKCVAKGSKSEFHRMIADTVFSVDPDGTVRADFLVNPSNYVKSVDNLIIRNVFFLSASFCLCFILGCEKNIVCVTRSLGRLGPDYNMKIYRRGVI
jgi:hypothetical protein